MDNIQFCNDSTIYEQIVELISKKIVTISKDEIKRMYSIWFSNFHTAHSEDFKINRSQLPTEFDIPLDACYLGLDFPTWLNFESTKKKIMLIGIDPLRNEDAFKGFDSKNDVLIGTPYALHHKRMRDGRTRDYWKFIELLSESFSVYLTDIFKAFYYRNKYQGIRSYLDLSGQGICTQEAIFEIEIKLINPDIIIAMGNQAVKLITKQRVLVPSLSHTNISSSKLLYGNKIPVIPMVHLSGGSYENHKQSFLKANGYVGKNYGELYFKIINDYLKTSF